MDKDLRIDGAVANSLSLSVDELRHSYPPYTVQPSFETDNGIISPVFVGAWLWDILRNAQVTADPSSDRRLRVVAQANDGVHCTIRWNELDPAVTDRLILVAYERDGEPIAKGGPLRLVVPGDKQGRRFLRSLVLLTVLTQITEENSES